MFTVSLHPFGSPLYHRVARQTGTSLRRGGKAPGVRLDLCIGWVYNFVQMALHSVKGAESVFAVGFPPPVPCLPADFRAGRHGASVSLADEVHPSGLLPASVGPQVRLTTRLSPNRDGADKVHPSDRNHRLSPSSLLTLLSVCVRFRGILLQASHPGCLAGLQGARSVRMNAIRRHRWDAALRPNGIVPSVTTLRGVLFMSDRFDKTFSLRPCPPFVSTKLDFTKICHKKAHPVEMDKWIPEIVDE